ncbi:MAG: TraR/DksA family transcriptional regulator, partial [Nitrosospira sp.]
MAKLAEDQLAQLKISLQQRYLDLREEVRGELERSGEQRYIDLAGSVRDAGDGSVADMLLDINTAMVDRQVHEMREVEASLKRLAELDFGDCIDCGGEIGFDRLMAYPTAQRCVQCQEVHEKTYAHE